MSRYALSHLSDRTLLEGLAALIARDRSTTAELLAHIAEVDARKLYLPAAYPSMYAYCVGELRLSEEAAFKRIHAARAARRFPAIFEAVADGRLHLSGVILLAPYLNETTAAGLLPAAANRTKAGIERLLAERFPRSEMLTWVAAVPAPAVEEPACQHAPGRVGTAQVVDTPRVRPLTARAFSVQFTMSKTGHKHLPRAQELLGHQVPSGDIARVFERALELLVAHLEKQKFAATDRPRPAPHRESANPRHIPAAVKRAVWARDQGRCTFVNDTGRRCEARSPLEFDHALEVARGGEASVSDLQLRCRAHNQHTAERTFGEEFMRRKRVVAAAGRGDG